MLTRSLARLWTPKYFRGQNHHANKAVRHPGPRRTRIIDSAQPPARPTDAARTPFKQPQQAFLQKTQIQATEKKSCVERPVAPSSTPMTDPLVLMAQSLLMQLAHPTSLSSSATAAASEAAPTPTSPHSMPVEKTAEATRNFVAFTARRDVLGPLRRRLPPAPAHLLMTAPRGAAHESNATNNAMTSGTGVATPRLRVISSQHAKGGGVPAPLGADPSLINDNLLRPYRLDELVAFLQLYDAVGADDGVLLVQLMAEVHRELFAYAALQRKRNEATVATTHASHPASQDITVESSTAEMNKLLKKEKKGSGGDGMKSNKTATLPLPALLFTMSSLGVVEEAVLDLVTSVAPAPITSLARRGLLYPQLPLYSTEELITLIIALHRFGHAQQPSMKAATKALRALLYQKNTPASTFHRAMKEVKKRLNREVGTPSRNGESMPSAPTESLFGSMGTAPDSAVRVLQSHPELTTLVLQMQCPLFLLLEALTASSLTVYRRADVVTFLSDLIAVTAVVELTEDTQQQRIREEAQAYAMAVAHQLLRAAKLTEEMEQPQPLLSAVFAWSCTFTGKGVVVDGGEDSAVPSDRVAYYDHVTADLIKASRTD